MKHTPGPWTVKVYKAHKTNKPQYEIESKTGLPICVVCDVSKQPVKANANLIAAAPELLQACLCALADLEGLREEGLFDDSFGKPPQIETIEELEDAIKKAKGKL
ncbi:hypothetical protein KAR91_44140 [Candidatus Pacearchaeota archaeon]|nr:hypothetical protein [Candidatus Pacearchaeota archaeon]